MGSATIRMVRRGRRAKSPKPAGLGDLLAWAAGPTYLGAVTAPVGAPGAAVKPYPVLHDAKLDASMSPAGAVTHGPAPVPTPFPPAGVPAERPGVVVTCELPNGDTAARSLSRVGFSYSFTP